MHTQHLPGWSPDGAGMGRRVQAWSSHGARTIFVGLLLTTVEVVTEGDEGDEGEEQGAPEDGGPHSDAAYEIPVFVGAAGEGGVG